MDLYQRLGFIGIGAAALALASTQLDSLSISLANINPFARAVGSDQPDSGRSVRKLMLERELSVGPGGTLSVEVDDADVTVEAGSTDRATVRVFMSAGDRDWGRRLFEMMQFDAGLHGNEVSVTSANPRVDWSEQRGESGGVDFLVEIVVPQSFDATIRTGDGDISLADFAGAFDLKTADGDISVGRLTGTVVLRTSDGDVHAEMLAGEAISVRTSDGDVQIGELAGPGEISTSDGDISVRLEGVGELNLSTGDGDITIYAHESLQAHLDFSGESVDLDTGFVLSNGRISEQGIRGDLNGGGGIVQARTGDGTISMKRRTR